MQQDISTRKAHTILKSANRVLVIGISGGGKSTLSARIEATYGLPHISMDRDVRWLPGWQVRARTEQRALVETFVAQDQWVIDGTDVGSFEQRVPRADLVIWIRTNRWRALWQLTGRVWRSYGRVRPDMAEGCPEQLPDREFLGWIWTFEKRQGPRIVAGLAEHGPEVPVVMIRTRRDADAVMCGNPRNLVPASGGSDQI